MTTIGDAVAALRLDLTDDETVCIVIKRGQRYVEHSLDDVATQKIDRDTFISTGTFPRDMAWGKGARTLDNVLRIWALPFDFDLKDYLHVDADDLFVLAEDELDTYRASLRGVIENVAGKIGLPIHRLDSTGYGLSAYVHLPYHDPEHVPTLKTLHGRIVDRINAVWGEKLADNVRDAGPRIMRLVPCLNAKGPIPRHTRTLYFKVTPVDQAMLEAAAGPYTPRVVNAVPRTGKGIPDELADLIVERVRPDWIKGQKHHMGRALAGYLAKNQIPEEQAVAIVARLSVDDDRPRDRIKTAQDTYTRYRQSLDIDGYMALRSMMDAGSLAEIDTVLERHRAANAPRLIMGGKRDEPKPARDGNDVRFGTPPSTAYRGWIGQYVELMQPTTEAPSAFHLGVGFTFAGAILGRDVWCNYGEPMHANLFTLLIGASGKTRKDTAIRRGTRMVSDHHITNGQLVSPITRIITDIGSAEALMDMLAEHANLMLYATEFSKLMGNARRKGTSTIIPTLMQAWDAPITMSSLTRGKPVEAHFPYLSVIAATQPEILANLMSEDDVFSGFANRWFYVAGDPTNTPIPSPPPVDHVLSAELYDELKRRSTEASGRTGGIGLSPDALQRWDAWYRFDYHRSSETPEEDAMRPRHAPLIRKLALIYAATEGTRYITTDQLDAAISVIEWMGTNVRQMVGTWGQSPMAKLERRIKDVLAAAPNRTMRRRDLQRKCSSRSWTARDFGMSLDALKASDVVLIDAVNNVQLTEVDDDHVAWKAGS